MKSEEWEQIPLLISIKGCDILSKIEEKVEKAEIKTEKKNESETMIETRQKIEKKPEGKNYFLRIFIDKEDGIDLNDCEKVNNEINEILDTADYIKEAYFLEVSSPGIERILRKDNHLKQNIGNEVSIKLFGKDANGKKEYIGILEEFNEEFIIIEVENEKIKIERKNISQIKTVYNWD